MSQAKAAHRGIGDRLWEAAEPFVGQPVDEDLASRMQKAVNAAFEQKMAKLPSSLRPLFIEPTVRIEHGEGLRLPPTNVELDFPEPIAARFRL